MRHHQEEDGEEASAEEPLIQSLADLMEGVDDVLERTRSQMQTSKRFLKRMDVLQGGQGFHRLIRLKV